MKSFSLHPTTLHDTFWAARSLAHPGRYRLTHRPSGLFVEAPFTHWDKRTKAAATDALAKKVRGFGASWL